MSPPGLAVSYTMTADEPTWTPWTRPRIAVPVLAAATCVGYYLASLIGLQLRFLPATTSIMWPPNAVLTAALVLAPPRRWFAILLCVLPVHIIIQIGTGWQLSLILALFVTNCSEALIAAGGMSGKGGVRGDETADCPVSTILIDTPVDRAGAELFPHHCQRVGGQRLPSWKDARDRDGDQKRRGRGQPDPHG